ncbi:MAG TPA: type II toxin-antitoxin system mRNA interferase toxin, RelE/StbE family [Candidatus Paceibacterota bacterium]
MDIFLHSKFEKKLARVPMPIRRALADRIGLFKEDRRHPLLNDHALMGNRKGLRSINITGDWRVIYEPLGVTAVRFLEIDTHHNLYGT